MRACPSCRQLGIHEHSVIAGLEALRAMTAGGAAALTVYSRCVRCNSGFRRDGPDALVPAPEGALDRLGPVVWIIPPWRRSAAASFELSWDVAEAFFERLAGDHARVRPLGALIAALRAAGFGARLRAGQSLDALGLSRAREHGLQPGHSRLFLHPVATGELVVKGKLGATSVELGPVEATLTGPLRATIEALAQRPIE